jgi:hypothetical protein
MTVNKSMFLILIHALIAYVRLQKEQQNLVQKKK